jgi:hypothetical protein
MAELHEPLAFILQVRICKNKNDNVSKLSYTFSIYTYLAYGQDITFRDILTLRN